MTPLVYGLIRNSVRKIMPGLVRRGFSFRSIARTLRGAGFGYRTARMLEDFREAEGIWIGEKWAAAAPSLETYKKGWMIEEDLRFPAKYRLYFDMDVFDTETGAAYTKTVSMYTDDLLSPEEWEDKFREPYEKEMYDPVEAITKMRLRRVSHNKGMAY